MYQLDANNCLHQVGTSSLLKLGNVRINVTLRRVGITTVALEKQYYIICVCARSISYPARRAHAPYCPALQYFSTLSHKRHNFRKKKKLLHINVCYFFYNSV